MNKLLGLMILFVLTSLSTRAQHGWNLKENANWTFADSLRLDFSNGGPDTSGSSVYTLSPNCQATVSDPQGNLLFYTNSERVWDRNGNVMPSGNLISATLYYPNGTPSANISAESHGAPQGVIILPVIGNPQQYYIFALSGWVFGEDVGGPLTFLWLNYSIVDMSLNGGLGDLTGPPVMIDSGLSAHMTAVPGDDCNIWLLVHGKREAKFKAYEITAAGVSLSPVISNTGYTPVTTPDLGDYSHGYGSMQVTPDRRRLAYTSPYQLFPDVHDGKIELFDFDPGTGIVSNELTLDSLYSWDLAFSSDNSKLYATSCKLDDFSGLYPFYTVLYQWDLSQPTPAGIVASETVIDTLVLPYTITSPLRLTPDGKIYYIKSNSAIPADADYLGAITQPNLAGAACANVQHAVLTPHRAYYLDDNVSGIGSNNFVRPIPSDTVFSRKDTLICGAWDSLVLKSPVAAIYYSWNDGSVDTTLTVTAPGTYWVGSGITYCSYRIDTFVIAPVPYDTVTSATALAICEGRDTLTLQGPPGSVYYNWSNGSTAPSIAATQPGIYWVGSGVTLCQNKVDSFIMTPAFTLDLGNDTTICNVTGYMLVAPDSATHYLWQDGSAAQSYMALTSGSYWVEVQKNGCEQRDTVDVLMKDLRRDLGPDLSVCKDRALDLELKVDVPSGAAALWSTGQTTDAIKVNDTGLYWVQITDAPCSFSDTLFIGRQFCECVLSIPTAFSPNRDGLNDVFGVLFEPGCPVRSFDCAIYNRWGQKIFTSTDPAQGWDGTWNGEPADIGTYMYSITTSAGTKGGVKQYKGDITLIR